MPLRKYIIVQNFFSDGRWQTIEEEVEAAQHFPNRAGARAQEIARQLDEEYGDSQFWTVTIKNEQRQDYLQLFHGRLD